MTSNSTERLTETSASLGIRRLRMTYVASRAHGAVRAIRLPRTFEAQLLQPEEVSGLQVDLPWTSDSNDTNRAFWSHVAEVALIRAPKSAEEAARLRRQTVPLRHRAQLNGPLAGTRLEIFMHPFGWTVLATCDIDISESEPSGSVLEAVVSSENVEVQAAVGDWRWTGAFGEAAEAVADGLRDIIGDSGAALWNLDAHRLISVIDAELRVAPTSMPGSTDELLSLMHSMSLGGSARGRPPFAFVARWTGQGFDWAFQDLVYVGSRGTAIALLDSATKQARSVSETTSSRHRRQSLLVAHVLTSATLAKAATESGDQFIREWGRQAADRVGRLYAPTPADSEYWGLEAQQLLKATGADAFAAAIRGAQLTIKYQSPSTY
jgi:hypothetical protein